MLKNKAKKILHLLANPNDIGFVFVEKFGRKMAGFLKNKPFFLQSQMDIHPLSIWMKPDFIKETSGFLTKDKKQNRQILELEPWDNTRRDMIILFLRTVIENKIDGDFAELGVYKGLTAKLIHKYAPDRKIHLFDTFSGFNTKGSEMEMKKTGLEVKSDQFSDTNVESVKNFIQPNENLFIYKGYFPENLPKDFSKIKFAFVHLDADLYDPTMEGLKNFYNKITSGGIILIHDYNSWIGARAAVDEFFKNKPENPIPMPDKSGSAIIIKQ